jgi:hypothetical protein
MIYNLITTFVSIAHEIFSTLTDRKCFQEWSNDKYSVSQAETSHIHDFMPVFAQQKDRFSTPADFSHQKFPVLGAVLYSALPTLAKGLKSH